MTRLISTALMVTGLGILLTGCLIARQPRSAAQPTPIIPPGAEQPMPGATYENGYNVYILGPCDFAATYASAKLLTGPPIATFDGRGQSFYFLRLVCTPTDPTARMTFDALGSQALLARGMVRLPDSEPHPILRAFLVDAQQAGLDVRATFGRVISPPLCLKEHCQQYLDNVLIEFSATDPTAPVRFVPLGCQLALACARAQLLPARPQTNQRGQVLGWVGGGLGLIGAALLVYPRLAGRRRVRITI